MERLTLFEVVFAIVGTIYFIRGFIKFIKLTLKGL